MIFLRQSGTPTLMMGPFLDSGDGNTVENGLSIASTVILLSKNGGAFGAKSSTVAATVDPANNGYYSFPLNATDTGTLGHLRINIHVAGVLAVWEDAMVMPANAWDSLFGSDLLQVDATQWLGTAITAGSIPTAVAGATGGLFIAGTNAATTITTSLTTHLVGTVDTVTTLTNLPAVTTDWLTAAGIAAAALNGKGDWSTVIPDAAGVVVSALTIIKGATWSPSTDTLEAIRDAVVAQVNLSVETTEITVETP